MNTKKIYLVRHGAVSSDGEKRYIGQTDLPLNDNGRKQVARLRDQLSGVPFNLIYCSDLVRSVSTAEIICEKQELKPLVIKDLREIDMGLWDGLSFQEVVRLYPGEFEKRGSDIVNYAPPKGESFALCAVRVMAALDNILAAGQGNILIVGHAGVNRIIISWALGLPMENMFRLKQDYGCLNILTLFDFVRRVEVLNFTS